MPSDSPATLRTLAAKALQQLLDLLRSEGYEVVGPTVRDGAVTLGPLTQVGDLPRGVTTSQRPGRYRLEDSASHETWFSYGPAATGLKPWLHVPREPLVTLRRKDGAITREVPSPSTPKRALMGARACDLAAVARQDHVLAQADPAYAARRAASFVIAVSCDRAVESCFCPSMGTGPRVSDGYDLCLTEIHDDQGHRFILEVGSDRGAAIAEQLPTRATTAADARAPDALAGDVARQITRRLDDKLAASLKSHPEHPRLSDAADRCLSCTNCTLVCPTCFCSTVEDTTTLDEQEVTRSRRWDSCFSPDFSHMHGGTVRQSTRARYRQWITHKLSTWHDQFGESGCVGCGRCITWCPVGIDITAEATAIMAGDAPNQEGTTS